MSTFTAFPREDLAPLIDWIAERSSEKASRHRSQHSVKKGWFQGEPYDTYIRHSSNPSSTLLDTG